MNIPNADAGDDVDAVCSRSYLICAAPRTGSTLLSSMLMSVGVAGQPFEFLHELSMREFFARLGRPLELDDYVKFLKERRCSRSGVFGFKAQYNQLSDVSSDVEMQRRFVGNFDSVVLVYRKNSLAQAISHYRALQSGVWHAPAGTNDSGAYPPPGEYDAAAIATSLAAVIGQSESWRRLLRKCEVNWLEVAYEDLSQDPVGTLRRVLKHLGIDAGALRKAPRPTLRRLSDEVSREWGRRFVADLLGEPVGCPGDNLEKPMTWPKIGGRFLARR